MKMGGGKGATETICSTSKAFAASLYQTTYLQCKTASGRAALDAQTRLEDSCVYAVAWEHSALRLTGMLH